MSPIRLVAQTVDSDKDDQCRVWQNMDRVAESHPELLVQRLLSSTAAGAAFELAQLLELDEAVLQEVGYSFKSLLLMGIGLHRSRCLKYIWYAAGKGAPAAGDSARHRITYRQHPGFNEVHKTARRFMKGFTDILVLKVNVQSCPTFMPSA